MNVTIGSQARPAVNLAPQKYKWSALGGPKDASIEATGEAADLWTLLQTLGADICIDDAGRDLWWGQINQVTLHVGQLDWIAPLDGMSNRLAVAYEQIVAGASRGVRATTDYAEDAASIARYGIRELLMSSQGTTAAAAIADRDSELAQRAMPILYWRPGGQGMGRGPSASIYCRGWWDTLSWRYASVPVQLALGYATIGARDAGIGRTTGDSKLAQAIDTGPTALDVTAVAVYVRKVGAPADNLTVSICANPDDMTPGSPLASASIAGSALTTSYAWVQAALTVSLSANTSYFLQVSRSGAADDDNYYLFRLDANQGYPAGPLRNYDGDWDTTAADMPWRLYINAAVPTVTQIKSLITTYGQFFTRVQAEVESGYSTESYQNGDKTAARAIEYLMVLGTTNKRRVLARVDRYRQVRIYEEPAASSVGLFVDNDFNLTDASGNPVDPHTCPVGEWCRPAETVVNVDTALQRVQAGMFIEEMEYDCLSGRLTPTPRTLADMLAMGDLRDG